MYGDITMKEKNQDMGGKIVGLAVGALLLQTDIGMHLDSPEAIQTTLSTGLAAFLLLSLIHVVPLFVSVTKLELDDSLGWGKGSIAAATPMLTKAALTVEKTEEVMAHGEREEADKEQGEAADKATSASSWFERMMLPPGFPDSLDPNYARFRAWGLLSSLINQPKSIFLLVIEWENIYGVGQPGVTPLSAVTINLYRTCVSAVIGLLVGMPAVREYFSYKDKRWFLRSSLLSMVHGPLYFLAAAAFSSNRQILYALITFAEVIAAFASTSGARINGSISPAMIRNSEKVRLVDVKMADKNQDRVVGMAALSLSLGLLHMLRQYRINASTHLTEFALAYALLHTFHGFIAFKRFQSLPSLPEGDTADDSRPEHEVDKLEVDMKELGKCEDVAKHMTQLLAGLGDPAKR
eukprot:6654644-Prymnesium_polylepis.1